MAILRVHRTERGTSLAEVLIALAILAFVGVAMIAGIFVAVKGNTVSRNNILAEGLARYELEYVKSVAAKDWTNIINQTNPYTIPSAQGPLWNPSHNVLPEGYDGYTIVVTLSPIAGYDSNIRKVNTAVSYQGSNVISIDTYIVKP